MKNLINSLYVIIDPSMCLHNTFKVAKQAIKGGAGIIQLRYKSFSDMEFLNIAVKLSKLCMESHVLFLVNDRVDIAELSGADGVHLGQNDLPVAEARRIFKKGIIGISTHNKKEVKNALRLGADYIGFGPVFKTNTKSDLPSVVGLRKLKEIKKLIDIPLVAIGGINESNIKEVMKAGADAVAILSAVCKAKSPLTTTLNLSLKFKTKQGEHG